MSNERLDELIEKLNDGDMAAAEKAFLSFEPYLHMAVRRRLSKSLRSKLDSMDIVQSVWADLMCRFQDVGWRFNDRCHLRAFLLRVVQNRLTDRRRQHQRALQKEERLETHAAVELPGTKQPRPSEVAQENELWNRMLDASPPSHHEILILKRQGATLPEIASRTGLHEGSIRRILYELARRLALPRRRVAACSGLSRAEG
jgi:RNA polymerase sigma-70 factor (ECF subfamily)